MKTVLKKRVKSASVRVPAVIQAVYLELDRAVDGREEPGRVVIEPAPRKEYDLAELARRITPRNVHNDVDFGKAMDKAD